MLAEESLAFVQCSPQMPPARIDRKAAAIHQPARARVDIQRRQQPQARRAFGRRDRPGWTEGQEQRGIVVQVQDKRLAGFRSGQGQNADVLGSRVFEGGAEGLDESLLADIHLPNAARHGRQPTRRPAEGVPSRVVVLSGVLIEFDDRGGAALPCRIK